MKKIFFVLSFILLMSDVYSQEKDKDQIVVIGSATLEVPADIIKIRITLSFRDRVDAKTAYKQHKDAEEKLLELLKEENFHDSLITYSLLSVSTSHDPRIDPPQYYTTNQTVAITISNFSEYPSIHLLLIENGFTNFSQSFESTKSFEAMEEAIQLAVRQATHKAELMAGAAGRKIKKISKISDTEEREPTISSYYGFMIQRNTTDINITSLSDIRQTIQIQKQVKAVFDLE